MAPKTDDIEDDEEIDRQLELESAQTMFLNMSAAQLREALLVFHRLSETRYFHAVQKKLTADERIPIEKLQALEQGIRKQKGIYI